jgi:hypothetical protein
MDRWTRNIGHDGRIGAPRAARLTLPVLPVPGNEQTGPYTGRKSSEALDMAEIQKPAERTEQKPDAPTKKPDNLAKDRAVTGDQVAEADAQRTSKFSTFGDMKAYADSNPLLIDMGDGTEVSSKGASLAWKPESIVSPHKENPDQYVDHTAFRAAKQHFNNFAKYDLDHPGMGEKLVSALIRNESVFYNSVKDGGVDTALKTGIVLGNRSIGPAQMRVNNVMRLVEKHPELFGEKKNYPGLAETPHVATLLVAAYLDEKIETFENWSKKLPSREALNTDGKLLLDHAFPYWKSGMQTKALIMSYNPGDGSRHLNHVLDQLKNIEEGH